MKLLTNKFKSPFQSSLSRRMLVISGVCIVSQIVIITILYQSQIIAKLTNSKIKIHAPYFDHATNSNGNVNSSSNSDLHCNCEGCCLKQKDLQNGTNILPLNRTIKITKVGSQTTAHPADRSSAIGTGTGTAVSRSPIMTQGGNKNAKEVKNVFILATWRSGSSFFGEVLSSHPDIYYHFEPLMYFDYQEISSGQQLIEAFWTLKNLSDCNYAAADKYMERNRVSWNLLSLNNKINEQCKAVPDNCFNNTTLLQKRCREFPVQLFKLTRLRGTAFEEIFDRFQNAQIIYLVRDPRAIYSSRMKVNWCPLTTTCGQINLMCKSLKEDLVEIIKLQAKYPNMIQVIKYEHTAMAPSQNFQTVFSRLGIPWHKSIQEYITAHTSEKENNDTMSTVKLSNLHVDQWKTSLPTETINTIELDCHQFLLELGYEFINPGNKSKIN